MFDLAKSKLLILKILELSQGSLPLKVLLKFVLEKDKLNYFYFMQYLQELEKADLIEKTDQQVRLTSQAYESLKWFGDQVTDSEIQEIQAFLSAQSEEEYFFSEEEDTLSLEWKGQTGRHCKIEMDKAFFSKEDIDYLEKNTRQIIEGLFNLCKDSRGQ